MFRINSKEIHIFDIDGCIFPMKNNKGEQIMPCEFSSKFSTEEILNKMIGVELYPSFINFYNLIVSENKKIQIYFITGRKKKDYQIITLEQLSILNTILNRDNLIFFPNKKSITRRSYYNFKIDHILEIINNDNNCSNIYIYDDIFEYFHILRERLNDNIRNICFYDVNEPEQFWFNKYREYKNLIDINKLSKDPRILPVDAITHKLLKHDPMYYVPNKPYDNYEFLERLSKLKKRW
jgi:hypothetical protein